MIRFYGFEFKERQWASLDDIPFKLPKLQSHRGYWVGGQKENSIKAVQAAHRAGYEMAEVDLRLTRDGQIILYHDPVFFNVDQAKPIRELMLSDMRSHLGVDTLEELASSLPDKFYLNLEIKNESKIDFSLEERLYQFLKSHPRFQEKILLSSFNPFSLIWFQKLLPEMPRSLLVTQEARAGNSLFLRELSFLPLVKPHFLHMRWEDLDHYRDIPMERKVIWTLNEIGNAETLLKLRKVRSIITDSIRPDQIGEGK